MSEFPANGNLSCIAFPKLLMSLNRQRVSGTLSFFVDGIVKRIYFRKGDAIFASSTYEDDRLGEMLVKSGKITMEQYDRSVELLKKTGRRQGAILVELGYLTPKELFWGVKYQVREIIYSLFSCDQGEYAFEDGVIPNEVITLKMSMGNLIYEGVKRIDNWTRIRREMPGTGTLMKLNDDPLSLFQDVEFTTQDKKIISLVEGTRTIKQIIEDSWLNSFEATKILYVLWSIGIITGNKVEGAGMPVEEIFKPIPEGEETLRRKVDELYQRLSALDAYGLLEATASSTQEEIKKNYYRLAKEFHPDRFFDSDDMSLKDKLQAVFDAITGAYNELRKDIFAEDGPFPGDGGPDDGSSFESLNAEETVQDGEPVEAEIESAASGLFSESAETSVALQARAAQESREGQDALKRGDIEAALGHFREAVRLDGNKPSYWSHLAFAVSRTGDGFGEAEHAMLEAIRLDPTKGDYYANLGLLYLKEEMPEKARRQFEKSLAIEPSNQKARIGLRQLEN
ncbi:MAG: DUF4388 domain-containing protein [Nitrospiraceae bacterium]|nr:DUF4388 domain-containing protein [Nitrospiraceae bacterium]